MTGRFIVLEGLDGSGITTQTEFLRTWCQAQGLAVSVTKEPTDGPAGGVIKWALRKELVGLPEEALALLFAADRHHHVEREIRPRLEEGAIIICDRYFLSSYAYQLVGVGDLQWLRHLNARCPVPDLTVFLDVPPEQCVERMASDVWRGLDKLQLYEEVGLLKTIRKNFLSVIETLRKEGHNIVIVDAVNGIDAVGNRIQKEVKKIIGTQGSSPIRSGNESRQIAAILRRSAAAG